ncbi:NYN domain-containing protein [Almyronema epifaneia]|uniref:NYN domain-containing protein n=1 Tax=Almyronema epifaneia S1 TaxID=2991925 RepID=A0ABW6IJZ0_9CYAN
MSEKVAVFLDVENLSGWLKADGGEALLERSSELGRVVVRRAYGDFSRSSVSVRQAELSLLGFEFVHVYHSVKGKNSADIQIVVDVMEYLARIPDLEWFVLATGDSDFSPLFRRLRELGKSVVGVGPRSALSEAVKKSCNRFIYIDEKNRSHIFPDASSESQLREDALDLLERVLARFPDGTNLSVLKNAMLEIDSSFDERTLGFSGFMKFLESAPETVTVYKVKQVWHAKALEVQNETEIALENNFSAETVVEPSTDLYKRLLRKSGWRSCSSLFLWTILTNLQQQFPEGFTRSQEFEYLVESFGDSHTRGEIRAAIYILYKGKCVVQINKNPSDEPVFKVLLPASLQAMAKNIDVFLVFRLFKICQSNNVRFSFELLSPLLTESYTEKQLKGLIKDIQE